MLGIVLGARNSMAHMTDIVLGLKVSVPGSRTFTGVEHLNRWIFCPIDINV